MKRLSDRGTNPNLPRTIDKREDAAAAAAPGTKIRARPAPERAGPAASGATPAKSEKGAPPPPALLGREARLWRPPSSRGARTERSVAGKDG
ncbi:SR-related and CTD-associated factor 4-like [Dipodomys spectabilis]|uniref:SR-related and CTD-associated factor 4-like n=1 Tax=Dipodomys spectabilis TaxID=105255 RepID=UPI001C537F03|nr:SR-related and CTD-associated factor 4-like [Dipodomys spectabilis]